MRSYHPISVPLLALLLLLAGCGGDGGGATSGEEGQREPGESRAEGTGGEPAGSTGGPAQEETTGASGAMEEAAGGASASEGDVVLEIGGSTDLRFVGDCTIGEEERQLEGQVPERFVLEPGEEELECRVVKRGSPSGTLEVVLIVDGQRYVQTTDGRWGSITVVYSGSSVSSSVRSSTSTASSGKGPAMSSGTTVPEER